MSQKVTESKHYNLDCLEGRHSSGSSFAQIPHQKAFAINLQYKGLGINVIIKLVMEAVLVFINPFTRPSCVYHLH